jgi:CYTH domain-containing protein
VTSDAPKYSLAEIERRWLADLSRVGSLSQLPMRTIEDLYVEGTRLRVRKIVGADSIAHKLCKKYGKSAATFERITNIYLTEEEYRLLCKLPGKRVRKRRYSIAEGSLDIYDVPKNEIAIFEIEFPDEQLAHSYVPPDFATREITDDATYSGAMFAAL